MELYIDRDELIRGLARVQGIVERRTTNPALAHVLLSASGERLRMTATDTTLSLVADYPARVEDEGELTVDAQHFFQIARSLPEPTVHLRTSSANRISVRSGTAQFHVPGMAAEDFPALPARDDRASLRVKGSGLRRVIEETIYAVSSDDNRYGLNGAHLEEVVSDDGSSRVRLVTTDGSRLSVSETTFEGNFGMGRRMLLPRKALGEVKKLVDQDDADWDITFGERSATLGTDGLTLMVRLVDGDFPDYRQVLPESFRRQVTLGRADFTDALRRVSIVASDRNHSVRFGFEVDRVVLSAQNIDLGDAREELNAALDGDPLYTGFNVKYFQDILGATKSDRVVLELGEALDPCIVRLPDRDDCLFVVMPMRLD